MFLLAVASIDELFTGMPLIVLAGIAMYIASKALADALVGGRANRPGRLALGHWLPIAVLAVGAVVTGRAPVAMGLIFSSSVACLCLGTGAVAVLGYFPEPGVGRRSWTMLLPAALLMFLAGFQGAITLWIAGVFVLQGALTLLLWTDRGTDRGVAAVDAPTPVVPIGRGMWFRIAQFILAICVAAVGAWCALHGITQVSAGSEFASAGLLTATLLSPLLALPIIGAGTELSQRHQSAAAVDSQMGVVLLNICALLPIVVGSWYARQVAVAFKMKMIAIIPWHFSHSMGRAAVPVTLDLKVLPLPLGVWRVDVVMLVALGLFVMPVALGRWSITKQQGLGMMIGYAVYLALAIKFQGYVLYGVQHP